MTSNIQQRRNLHILRNSPLCIVCGEPDQAETIARGLGILDYQLQSAEVADLQHEYTFYCGQFTLADGSRLDYYVTSSARSGTQPFMVQTSLLTHILRPRFIVHAGDCAGNKAKKIRIGDVIFGDSALNAEEGKYTVNKAGKTVFLPDYHPVDVRIGDMQAFADDGNRLGTHYGDFITVSAFRGDGPQIFNRINTQVRRGGIGLDTEASAFLELCRYSLKDTICLGIVKGVSHFGDSSRGLDPTGKQMALLNAAKALRDWIVYSIPSQAWEDNQSVQPLMQMRSSIPKASFDVSWSRSRASENTLIPRDVYGQQVRG